MHIWTPEDFAENVLPGRDGQPGAEGMHLDFKEKHGKPRDTALDIAAFANSEGGSLVFGVIEDPPDSKFAGRVNESLDAAKTVEHVEQSMTTWTYGFDERPRPQVVSTADGNVVVVNVRPSGRLISVRSQNRGSHSISYPFRHNHGNDYLKPEEVATRLDNRRGWETRAQLDTFMRRSVVPIEIDLLHLVPKHGKPDEFPAPWAATSHGVPRLTLLEADGARIQFDPGQHDKNKPVFTVPYSWIVSAWWNADKPALLVAAYFERKGGLVKGFPRRW